MYATMDERSTNAISTTAVVQKRLYSNEKLRFASTQFFTPFLRVSHGTTM